MLVTLLIALLSEPTETPVYAVLGQFKNVSECMDTIRNTNFTDEQRRTLSCLEIVKHKEA